MAFRQTRLLKNGGSQSRVRTVEYPGSANMTMIFDHSPINNQFRIYDDKDVLELRDFTLQRDGLVK
jgi:hypothetical protein